MKLEDIAWSETMNIDITSIDNEHKVLAQKLELLKLCFRRNEPLETLLSLFDDLIASVREHFEHEEHILVNIGYPGLDQHAKVHAAVLNKVQDYRQKLSICSNSEIFENTISFLDGSIGGHLSVEDGKIRNFIHRE